MRYRAGWLLHHRILALTHFEPVVTYEDFQGIAEAAQAALHEAAQPFHLLIDNRIIADRNPASLDTMLQAMPAIRHPLLRWIVIVLPEPIKESAASMDVQQSGDIRLKYVDSLASAWQLLRDIDPRLNGIELDDSFFAV
jgi:hypothetical protein